MRKTFTAITPTVTRPRPRVRAAVALGGAAALALTTAGALPPPLPAWAGCGEFACDACAPEVVESNVEATDRVLRDLAASPGFADADGFRAALAQLDGMDPAERVRAWRDHLGIDGNSGFVAFLRARTEAERRAFAAPAVESLGLTERQGEALVEALSAALVGELL